MNRSFIQKAVVAAGAAALLVYSLARPGGPVTPPAAAHPGWTLALLAMAAGLVFGRGFRLLARVWNWLCGLSRARFNAGVFGAALLAYAGVAWFVFKGIPRLDDGMAALFQARIFAGGAVALPLPDEAWFCPIFGVLGAGEALGHWCGMYPPGWPALLVPGVWLSVPWLVSPLLGAGLVTSTAELGRSFFGGRTGRAAALLALPSPFLLVLSGLHLSHMATALFLCLALLALRKLWAGGRWTWGGAAGICWGVAFLCRPVDAVVLGGLFALGFLLPVRRLARGRGGVAAGLAVALLAAGILLGFQQATTGDWRTPGHESGMGRQGQFGFAELGAGRAHTPALGLEHTRLRLGALNDNLLGWPVPALAIVLLPFLLGRARGKDALLLLPAAGLLGTFAFYWYYEAAFPARYVSAALPMLFVSAARGLFALGEATAGRGRAVRLPALLAVWGTLFLAVSLPHHFRRYDESFYDVEDVLPRVVRDYEISNAIVFMDVMRVVPGQTVNDYYATGFMRNSLDLDGDVLYVRNLRGRNADLLRRHPVPAIIVTHFPEEVPEGLAGRFYRLTGSPATLVPG